MKALCPYFHMMPFVSQNFKKMKFGTLVEICLWPYLAVKGLIKKRNEMKLRFYVKQFNVSGCSFFNSPWSFFSKSINCLHNEFQYISNQWQYFHLGRAFDKWKVCERRKDQNNRGCVIELLECWNCNAEAPSSTTSPTAIWICSRYPLS